MKRIATEMVAKFKSNSLPIIDKTMACANGKTTITDLENFIVLNQQVFDDGVFNALGVSCGKLEDFPSPVETEYNFKVNVDKESIAIWHDMLKYTAKDPLRPVMEALFLTKGHAVASDAHRLVSVPHRYGFNDILVTKDFVKHLYWLMGKLKQEDVTIEANDMYIAATCGEFTMQGRLIEGKYPDWEVAIPQRTYNTEVTLPSREIQMAVKEAKRADVEFPYVGIDVANRVAFLENPDFGVRQEFPIQVKEVKETFTNALLMPAMTGKDDVYGVSIPFLTMDTLILHEPTRAMLWNYGKAEPETKPKPKPEIKDQAKVDVVLRKDPKTRARLEIVHYSEKAIAIFGETKAHKDKLKELGCKFNPFLKKDGQKQPGWIASKRREQEIQEYIENN